MWFTAVPKLGNVFGIFDQQRVANDGEDTAAAA
jgi:hypothetical protein